MVKEIWENKCIVCKKTIKFNAIVGHTAFKNHIRNKHPVEFKRFDNIVKKYEKLVNKDFWLFIYW